MTQQVAWGKKNENIASTLDFLALTWQTIKDKENSEKPEQ